MTAVYVVAPAAMADLRQIASYTRRRWGKEQAKRYRDQLEQCFEAFADGTGQLRDLSHVAIGLRLLRCEHHYILGRKRDGQPATIDAVFHEKMDLMARIASRLNKLGKA